MAKAKLRPEAADIFRRLDSLGVKQRQLAEKLGIEENKVSKMRNGERQFQAPEILTARSWLNDLETNQEAPEPDVPDFEMERAYIPIEVLPTYGGAGGGGTGDGDRETALISRSLILYELRGTPTDFILINVRGDSMEPDFQHGDQLLVDKRDRSPSQPGPFALWDGEWGEYVIKNVERLADGEFRIFSSNPKYTPALVRAEATKIIGRPVWFARRL